VERYDSSSPDPSVLLCSRGKVLCHQPGNIFGGGRAKACLREGRILPYVGTGRAHLSP